MPTNSENAPPSQESGCESPEFRALLIPYALSSCTEEAEERFESHLLTCDACFRDLKAIDRTRELIQDFVGEDRPETLTARTIVRRRRWRRGLWIAGIALATCAAGYLLGRLG